MNGDGESDLRRRRFEFERELEERKLALEERKLEQARRESWNRTIGTVVIGGLLSAAVAGFGIYSEWKQDDRARQDRQAENDRAAVRQKAAEEQATANRRGEMLIQLVNAREGAVTDLRARMFDSLLRNYLEHQDGVERIAVLKMLGLNFRDAIQIKPLFEMLEQEMLEKKKPRARSDLKALRKAASSIVRDQVEQIRLARSGIVCTVALEMGEKASPDCMPDLQLELTKVEEGQIQLRTNSSKGWFLDPEDVAEKGDVFYVSFFDMPMIDYTTVEVGPDERWTYSIVLNDVSTAEKKAELTVAKLPEDSYSTRNAYHFDELLAKFLYAPEDVGEPATAPPPESASSPAQPESPTGS